MKKVKIVSSIILSLLLACSLYAQKETDNKCIFQNKGESDLWKSDTSGCKRIRASLGNQIVQKYECLKGKSYSYLLKELGAADQTRTNGNYTYLEYHILPAKNCFKSGQAPQLAEMEILQITVDNTTKMVTAAHVIMS